MSPRQPLPLVLSAAEISVRPKYFIPLSLFQSFLRCRQLFHCIGILELRIRVRLLGLQLLQALTPASLARTVALLSAFGPIRRLCSRRTRRSGQLSFPLWNAKLRPWWQLKQRRAGLHMVGQRRLSHERMTVLN